MLHFQGAVIFNTKQRFTAVRGLLDEVKVGVHWGKMRKTWKRNVTYCVKEAKGDWSKLFGNCPEASRYTPGEEAVMDLYYRPVAWRDWQRELVDIVAAHDPALPADQRTVYWYWEDGGNTGKSFVSRWLQMNTRCVVGTGKADNIFYSVAKMVEANPAGWPELVVLDIPRTYTGFVNYGALESLKNGVVNSGKYEGANCIFPPPCVVVFSNSPPQFDAMSDDRWSVWVLRTNSDGDTYKTRTRARGGGVSQNMV